MNNIGWGLVFVSLVSLGVLGCSAANKQISATDKQASSDEQVKKEPPQTLEEVFGDAQEGGNAQLGSDGPTPFGAGGPPPHGSGGSSTLEARPEMALGRVHTPEEIERRRRMQVRRKRLHFPLDVKHIAGEGRIKAAAVAKQLRRQRPALWNCYERGFKRGQDVAGYVGLRFSVGEDGRVSEAEIIENTSKSEALGACLTKRLLRLRFPKPEGGVVTFSWGVRLHAPKSGGEAPIEERPLATTEGKEAAGKPSSKPTAIASGVSDDQRHPWKPLFTPPGSKPPGLTPEEVERGEFRQSLYKRLKNPGAVEHIGGKGRMDPSLVRRSLRKHGGQFRYCYERSAKDGKRVEGWVGFRFSIGEKGRVSEAKNFKNTSRNKALVACLKRRLISVRFPRPEGGAVRFSTVFRLDKEKPKKKHKSGRPNKVIHKR